MVNRLPETLRGLVGAVALLGVSDEAFFEFHLSHWLGSPARGLPTRPEITNANLRPLVCVYGAEEADSPCRNLDGPRIRRVMLPGGHHFDGDYAGVARAILAAASPRMRARSLGGKRIVRVPARSRIP